jgi:hypothetical protein
VIATGPSVVVSADESEATAETVWGPEVSDEALITNTHPELAQAGLLK